MVLFAKANSKTIIEVDILGVQKLRFYLISLVVLLLSGLIALVYVMNEFAPDTIGIIALVYTLTWLVAFSASTIFGFYIRRIFGQREQLNNYIAQSSRQGIWLGLILVISLILSHNGLFSWINVGLLVFTFIFFEGYLLTQDNKEI